jgi:8-oxo-dGTP pyrophosphatase MutT (NUDIX family)
MSFIDHIRACNNYDRARVVPFLAGGRRIGWLRRDNAEALARFPAVFAVGPERVHLVAKGDVDRVSAAVDEVVEALVLENRLPKWRNEIFDVMPRWGEEPVFRVDRGAVAFFGVRAYGVDLNGYRRDRAGLHLWVGRRASDKRLAPNKLDNVVAGGIGNGYGVAATLAKEAEEEAGMPACLIERAVPVGAVTYLMENEIGIRDGVLFVYDLELPAQFVPQNRDGEVVEFQLMPARHVIERIRSTDDFKFDVNLVFLDFALRHGLIPIDDPEYLEVASGLHRPLD